MHFTGRTWRPPYEAHSVIIQATSGCTYNKCKFCTLYKNECFRMSPIEEFEEDLAEIKSYQPNARRIFWTGANPFAMSYENLKLRALTVRDYLIKCQTMAMFASIRDIKNKEVWQLRKLRAMGINGLSIGVESGDDETLALANKGYTSADILEQCRKLDEAYKAAKQRVSECKNRIPKLTQVLDLEKPAELSLDDCKVLIEYLLANNRLATEECRLCYMRGLVDGIETKKIFE